MPVCVELINIKLSLIFTVSVIIDIVDPNTLKLPFIYKLLLINVSPDTFKLLETFILFVDKVFVLSSNIKYADVFNNELLLDQ